MLHFIQLNTGDAILKINNVAIGLGDILWSNKAPINKKSYFQKIKLV